MPKSYGLFLWCLWIRFEAWKLRSPFILIAWKDTNPTYQKCMHSTDTYACPRKYFSDNPNTVLMTLKHKIFFNACLYAYIKCLILSNLYGVFIYSQWYWRLAWETLKHYRCMDLCVLKINSACFACVHSLFEDKCIYFCPSLKTYP